MNYAECNRKAQYQRREVSAEVTNRGSTYEGLSMSLVSNYSFVDSKLKTKNTKSKTTNISSCLQIFQGTYNLQKSFIRVVIKSEIHSVENVLLIYGWVTIQNLVQSFLIPFNRKKA